MRQAGGGAIVNVNSIAAVQQQGPRRTRVPALPP
jgi:hypothetical protein